MPNMLHPKTVNKWSKRQILATGAAFAAGIGLPSASIIPALAAGHVEMKTDIPTASGTLDIIPVDHASLILTRPGLTIYVDPVGSRSLYADLPPADLVLITHEHGDHYNEETLAAVAGDTAPIIANPSVFGKLPANLKARTTSLANGDGTTIGDLGIEAIAAYNTTPNRQNFHPEGRDNGYILSIDGVQIYIAGDTEDIPEMRALQNIDLAFVPMNLPYTMTVEQAASGVLAFSPKVVYPYHHRGSDVEQFKALVDAGSQSIEVRLADWY